MPGCGLKSGRIGPGSTSTADVHFDITEGNTSYVDHTDIEGNKATKTFVFKRELVIRPGMRFSVSKIRKSQERIRNLGFIDDVGLGQVKKRDDGATPTIELTENADILAELVRSRTGRTPEVVGFAAETGDDQGTVVEHGLRKLARKGCDLLVVNDVSAGKVFGRDDTEAVILTDAGDTHPVAPGPKSELAHVIWDHVVRRMG